jgi:hypothetical protein
MGHSLAGGTSYFIGRSGELPATVGATVPTESDRISCRCSAMLWVSQAVNSRSVVLMSDNNPFDRPPVQASTPPPVPGDWGPTTPFNPIGPRQSGPGRGKIAAVALGAAALTGGAIFGISKFADADDDATVVAAAPSATPPMVSAGSENVGSENVGSENGGGEDDGAAPMPSMPDVFNILSECIDIDEILESMGAGDAGSGTMDSMPSLDFTTIGESVGDTVVITSADGVTVYSLGEGDASIAISKSGDEVTVAASGDVTESTSVDFGDFEAQMDEMMSELENIDLENLDLGDMPSVSLPADFEACLENLN